MIPKQKDTNAAGPRRRATASAVLAMLLPVALSAQTAPAPADASDPAVSANAGVLPSGGSVLPPKDEVIMLSPFQVDTSKDNGYYAANTLSGTRLNSSVQDLGSSITVITKQQLEDTASIDINDIFRYEANTEGTFNFTSTSSSTPTSDQIQQNPAGATRIRGISSPNITVDYFVHNTRIPIDTYNVGSAEISRGPNSIIAGIGSPSGTINTNLDDANLSRQTTRVEGRVDSYGGYRASFNANQPIWKDKLGLRVAAVYANNAYEQKPSYDDVKRIYGALNFKPFAKTTIKFKSEVYHEERQSPNSLTPRDGVSEWVTAGKPVWNPVTWTATLGDGTTRVIPFSNSENTALPAGLYANSTVYTRPNMYIDNGVVQLWEVNRLSTNNTNGTPNSNPNANISSNARLLASGSAYMRGTVNAATLYTNPGVSNRALYDWTSLNATPTNWNYDHGTSYEAEIQQQIVDHLFFRGAWRLEDEVNYNRNIANPPTLQVDVNQKLLDGRDNPYFLRPYISAIEPTIFRSPEYNDAVQASLSYDFDLRQKGGWLSWLGSHVIGLNWENRRVTTGTFRYREAIIDPNHVWLTPGALNYTNGAAIGRPNYVYYVGPKGALGYTPGFTPPKSGVEGQYTLNYYNPATGQWVGDPATFGTSPYVSSMGRTQDTAKSVTWQGNVLKDHLVVTGGERRDEYQTRNSRVGATIDGTTGFYSYSTLNEWGPWTYAHGPTRFISGVLYPFKKHWLGLTYSKSSSFQPQPQAVDLYGNLLPNTYGHGHDYGFFMNLFDDKLVFSVKWYKQSIANDRTSNSTIGTRIARIEAGGNPSLAGTSSDKMSLWYWASQKIGEQMPAASQAEKDAAIAQITQFPQGFQNALQANLTGAAIRGTADTVGKGAEIELTYNPSYNWNVKFNAAQTISINTAIENNLQGYIDSRMAYWQSVHIGTDYFWTSTTYTSQSAKAFYDSAVTAPLRLDQALLGKSNPQVKKYSWKMLTTYRFSRGALKGFSVGGSARWDDKSVIGYLGGAADSDGIVRTLDVNHGVYDPARYQFDFWTSYSTKLFRDKVAARFQLNLNNAFEGGGLRAIGVNPDGQVFNYRIINPRQLVFTTRFDF
jgi:outer membrane receptor protein involved in Fe transport